MAFFITSQFLFSSVLFACLCFFFLVVVILGGVLEKYFLLRFGGSKVK